MSDLKSFFTVDPVDKLKQEILAMIRTKHDTTPRHLQKELGPSEVGHPCMRKMAYSILDAPRCNPQFDPLPSIIGVATHSWLQTAAEEANKALGRERWLTERRVTVTPGLSGSCDLYDTDTDTVIDWKVPGANQFAKYKKDPGPVYRSQVHMYGKGFCNEGFPVKTVSIFFIPRGGMLMNSHMWSEPYSQDIADASITRRELVISLLDDFKTEENPESFKWFPAHPYDCEWCPWFAVNPESPTQCRGTNA